MRRWISSIAVLLVLMWAATPAAAAPPTGAMGSLRYAWNGPDVQFWFGTGTATNGQYFTLHVSDGRTVRLYGGGSSPTGYVMTWTGTEWTFVTADYRPTCTTGPLSYYVTIDNVDGTGPATNTVTVEPIGCTGGGTDPNPDPGTGGGTGTAPTVTPSLALGPITCSAGIPVVRLSWSMSDQGAQYQVLRDGVNVATLPAGSTWWDDMGVAAGSSHTWQVIPANQVGTGPASNLVSGTIPADVCGGTGGGGGSEVPPTPPDLTGITADCTTVNITWSTVAGATGYRVYRGTTLLTTTTNTAYSGPIDRTRDNTYHVTALNGGAESTWSGSYWVQADSTCTYQPPEGGGGGGVLNLRSDLSQCPEQITVMWDPMAGAEEYVVYVLNNQTGQDEVVDVVSPSEPLEAVFQRQLGTEGSWGWTITVDARDANGNGLGSQSLAASCPAPPQPPPPPCESPAAPTVSGTFGAGAVSLTWSSVTNAVSYRVYMDGQQVAEVADLYWSGSYPLNGSNHTWSVTAVASCGAESGPGSAGTVSLVCSAVAPPQTPDLVRQDMDAGEVILTWNTVAGANGYNIYRRLETATTWDLVGHVETNAYNGYYPKDGRVYQYRVTAVNDCWESPATPTVEGSCLCSLKDYLTSGAPVPPPPDLPTMPTPTPPAPPIPTGQRPGKTVPPVPTLPIPPDVPPPPALPPVEDPNLCPWGMCAQGPGEGNQPTEPIAPATPTEPLAPDAPGTPTGPLVPSAPATPTGTLAPDAPGTPTGPLAPSPPLTPTAPLSPITPMAPMTPDPPLTPST